MIHCLSMATYPEYVSAAMDTAEYAHMDDGEWFASIPSLNGIWGTGATIEQARADLLESLHDWIDVHTKIGDHRLPDIDGIRINTSSFKPVE
jgi:predicted RNase H-like HicB family nuclease